jgi:hypothetical protein
MKEMGLVLPKAKVHHCIIKPNVICDMPHWEYILTSDVNNSSVGGTQCSDSKVPDINNCVHELDYIRECEQKTCIPL